MLEGILVRAADALWKSESTTKPPCGLVATSCAFIPLQRGGIKRKRSGLLFFCFFFAVTPSLRSLANTLANGALDLFSARLPLSWTRLPALRSLNHVDILDVEDPDHSDAFAGPTCRLKHGVISGATAQTNKTCFHRK